MAHNRCNTCANSNDRTAFDPARRSTQSAHHASFRLPDTVAKGGPSGHFHDFHGGLLPLPVLDPSKCRSTNFKRLNQWLVHEGYAHLQNCYPSAVSHTTIGLCANSNCPFGQKMVQIKFSASQSVCNSLGYSVYPRV